MMLTSTMVGFKFISIETAILCVLGVSAFQTASTKLACLVDADKVPYLEA